MSCGPEPVTFRLLDATMAWKLDLVPDPTIDLGEVIELAEVISGAVDPSVLAGWMAPPWIAKACAPCEWYLACCPTVLRYTCGAWIAIAGAGCSFELVEPVAVAATRDRVAILDAGRRELVITSPGGERVIATIPTRARGPIAFWNGAIVVADFDDVTAYDLTTLEPRALPSAAGRIARMAASSTALWIAVDGSPGTLELFRLHAGAWQPGTLAEAQAALPQTGIAAANDEAVQLAIPRGGAEPRMLCIDRCARVVACPPALAIPAREREGAVTTAEGSPLDSGVPRCEWHRVRIDLDVPDRTGVTVSVVTVEDPAIEIDHIAEADWQHVDAPGAIADFLIDQPPGRYLHLKIALRGDGHATPTIRQIRIDFPRSTSATRLPGVFREDPVAADFLSRFVALFDASLEDLDRAIVRFPALLDPASTPAEALAWLGTFLDITLDPAWSEATRRSILGEAAELYRRRGTPWALARAIQLTTGVAPAIQELGGTSGHARVARPGDRRGFRLNEARLFGAARVRVRLGASTLGLATLRSYGDPDRDHVATTAWRILVQVPASAAGDPDAVTRLRRLIDAQKPAHVVAQLRVGAELARIGIASAVGIDTRLGGLPLPILGSATRLRRMALARGRARGGVGLTLDATSAVSIQTVLV